MSDVREKRKEKKKSKKIKKSKKNNVISLKPNLKVLNNENPVSRRQAEIDKLNSHVKDILAELKEFVDDCSISREEAWYNIMYYVKQRTMHLLDFSAFKVLDKGSTKENIKNMAEFMDEHHPELKINHKPEKLH